MKLIHISDIHIHPENILGSDPVASFQACMEHVDTSNSDADLVIISGDLTHHGDSNSYVQLERLLLDWRATPLLMMGNHDNRDRFKSTFPHVPHDPNGFVQYVHDTEIGRFVLLDTAEEGTHAGRFCSLRQAWLRQQLKDARSQSLPVYLVMHHNPVKVGIPNADDIGLIDGEAFRQILTEYRDIVRHIFFGHCHYILSGSVCGIPFSAPRSTSHPCVPDFSGIDRMGYGDLSPTYNVCLLDDQSTVVHSIDFLKQSSIVWVDTKADSGTKSGPPEQAD